MSRTSVLLAVALSALGGCSSDYLVEQRQTPVHVWIAAPALGTTGGSLDALVYVGPEKAVQGVVTFPPGVTTVVLPTVYVNAGRRTVQAVLDGGAIAVSQDVSIQQECWVVVTVQGRSATVSMTREQPRIPVPVR